MHGLLRGWCGFGFTDGRRRHPEVPPDSSQVGIKLWVGRLAVGLSNVTKEGSNLS